MFLIKIFALTFKNKVQTTIVNVAKNLSYLFIYSITYIIFILLLIYIYYLYIIYILYIILFHSSIIQ